MGEGEKGFKIIDVTGMCNEFRDINFAYQSGEHSVSEIIAHNNVTYRVR